MEGQAERGGIRWLRSGQVAGGQVRQVRQVGSGDRSGRWLRWLRWSGGQVTVVS